MTTRSDLLTVRDAILEGADWLDAMLAVDSLERGSKRFVAMRAALVSHIPSRGASYLLSEFFAKAKREQVAEFFAMTAAELPGVEPAFPAWPVLSLPADREVAA